MGGVHDGYHGIEEVETVVQGWFDALPKPEATEDTPDTPAAE